MSNERRWGFDGWDESSHWVGQRSRMTERCEDLSMTTMEKKGTKRPWSYFLIRSVADAVSWPSLTISSSLLFRFVLKIFYGSIVVENPGLIPPDGQPWSVSPLPLAFFRSPASSASSARTTATRSRMLCVFPGLKAVSGFIDPMSSQRARRDHTIKGT